jgi:hypothetical protein
VVVAQTYANEGWMSWPDWLGHGVGQQPRGTFLPFAEARELVWLEDLATKEKWRDWCDTWAPLPSLLGGCQQDSKIRRVVCKPKGSDASSTCGWGNTRGVCPMMTAVLSAP